jgi:hypothetical protein
MGNDNFVCRQLSADNDKSNTCRHRQKSYLIIFSVESNPGIESRRFDSFGNFCVRARRVDSKVKELILNCHHS